MVEGARAATSFSLSPVPDPARRRAGPGSGPKRTKPGGISRVQPSAIG